MKPYYSISPESEAAYQTFMDNRTMELDYWNADFKAMTRGNTQAIEAISHLDDLTITWEKAGAIQLERILIPGAEEGKYIYYIHGGGWTNGEPQWGHYCTVEIARKCRRNILAVDYRLAPEVSYPVSHTDCLDGYKWMLAQGIPAENIVFLGESTGGNLVLTTAVGAARDGIPMPAAICSVSPVVDLSFPMPSYHARMERDCILPKNQSSIVKDLYVKGADTTDPFMSPIYADFTGFPPVYFEVSTEEMLFDDTIRTHEKLLRCGVDSSLKVWEGMWHTFYMMPFPETEEAHQNIAEFFKRF